MAPSARAPRQPPPRLVLGIETSTPAGGVALATTSGELLVHRWSIARTGYSRRLMQMIDSALADAEADKSALAAVAVSPGPGSFTGVRVGMMTAKTLALHLGLPLFLFDSLQSTARRFPAPGATVCVLLDARRGEIYNGVYRTAASGETETVAPSLETVRAPKVEPPDRLLDDLKESTEGPIWFSGDWTARNRDRIRAALGDRVRWVPAPFALPAADVLALQGAEALAAGTPPVDPLLAVPLYLRASDAEVNLARREAKTGS